jgi:cytochrome c-type biogenesis protein
VIPFAAELAQGAIERSVAGPAGIPVAFVVGAVSFFSPCTLPVLPGYLSYMSGVSAKDLEEGGQRRRVLMATALFVLGFAVIFTALGASIGAISETLLDHLDVATRVAGGFVIAMGLVFLSGLAVRRLNAMAHSGGAVGTLGKGGSRVVGFFMQERGLLTRPQKAGVKGAFPLGAALAVGWIPCVGPGLGAILGIAGTEGSVTRGATLLFAFSLGFGVWFVLGGLAFRKAVGATGWLRRHLAVLTAVGGSLMVALGVLLVTNQWGRIMAPLRRLIVRFAPPI